MSGHRVMGTSLLLTGEIAKAGHTSIRRSRFTSLPSIVRWRRSSAKMSRGSFLSVAGSVVLGYPDAALAGTDQALSDAREIGQAATLMQALC